MSKYPEIYETSCNNWYGFQRIDNWYNNLNFNEKQTFYKSFVANYTNINWEMIHNYKNRERTREKYISTIIDLSIFIPFEEVIKTYDNFRTEHHFFVPIFSQRLLKEPIERIVNLLRTKFKSDVHLKLRLIGSISDSLDKECASNNEKYSQIVMFLLNDECKEIQTKTLDLVQYVPGIPQKTIDLLADNNEIFKLQILNYNLMNYPSQEDWIYLLDRDREESIIALYRMIRSYNSIKFSDDIKKKFLNYQKIVKINYYVFLQNIY